MEKLIPTILQMLTIAWIVCLVVVIAIFLLCTLLWGFCAICENWKESDSRHD